MRRTVCVFVALLVAVALTGCDRSSGGKQTGSLPAPGGTGAAEKEIAASMISEPTFQDPFDGSVGVPGSISPAMVAESNYEGEWGPVTAGNPTAQESGGSLVIDEVGDYKGYTPSFVNASQGTFELLYTPANDILSAFTKENQPEWQVFGEYEPPANGFLIDTIGWRAAPQGSYGLLAGFTESAATISWGIWDGSTWHYLHWEESPWEPRPYRITASYGPAGVRLYIDGELVQEDASYAGGIDTGQPLVLGQAPWYWPYGPHSIFGEISEFKYSDAQID